jgi:putative toxin-antitoxin system antitoxin component (TIGR02293 family)
MENLWMRQATTVHGPVVRERAGLEVAARLSISLLGRPAIRFGGRLIELRTLKASAVLSYLALTEAKQESRERLVGLLWSRSDEEKARASLRYVVRELRTAFEEAGYGGFSAGRLSVHLDPEKVEVDVERIIRLAESGSVDPLLLNTPDFGERILEGMDDLDPSFRIWVLAKRQTIHDRLMRTLGAGLVAKDVAVTTRNQIATAIVNLDPTHEEACCHLMRVHADEGDIAGALRIYKALWDLLDRDYGMEPSAATEELVANLKLGAFNQPLVRVHGAAEMRALRTGDVDQTIPLSDAEVSAPTRTGLVLRPFAMHGIDNDHSHLVQGFHQSLAAALVRFQWNVVDNVSATVEHQSLDSAPQYSIETTAYQGEDSEINVVMVLKDSTTGDHLWNESFWLSPSYWYEAQRRIIRRVAKSLNIQLSAERLARLVGEPDVNLMANSAPESWQRTAILLGAIREYPTTTTDGLVAEAKLKTSEQPLVNGNFERAMQLAHVEVKSPAKTCLLLRPFAMHAIDSDHTHLVQGFHQHLAASLVRFREWNVIDRQPAIVALPATDSMPQYSIETTAYQAGSEINMVMVLRDDTTGIYVWSESFRLGLDNWFETQQRVIRRIATSLNVQLSAERLMRLAGEPDVSLDIHDRWLRGQSLYFKNDVESWQRAVTIFRDAIRENPTYSPCYSSLVQLNNIEHLVHPGIFRELGKAKTTLELAKQAVQLDPVDSRAHLSCGWSYVMAHRETEAASHIDLACELNDNDPWTLLSSALYSAFCESIAQARQRADQLLTHSLAPTNLEWGYHGIIRFLSGDYAGALEALDRAHGVLKTLPAWRTAALFHLGQSDRAREEAQRFLIGIRSSWVGSSAPTDEAVVRWALEAHPINVRARWEVLRNGLRGAGLPVEGIAKIEHEAAEQPRANKGWSAVGTLTTRRDGMQGRPESERLRHVADLLGGPKVVGKYPTDQLAAHEMLERGLPNTAIKYLLEGTTTLEQKSVESAIGMSVRTRQRREKHPTELLSQDQAGRTWKFAEILTRAISTFGSRTAAEQWLTQAATGLDQRRPIDLLSTPAGMELVEDFLGRIEYGVYP